jgi:hypothetical protein
MKLNCKESVPPGSYDLEFLGVEDSSHPEYGPGYNWQFKIRSGKWAGQKTGRITKDECTRKNSAGKLLVALTGKPFDVAKGEDPDDYIGQRYQGVLMETDSGATRVETIIAMREPGQDDA